MRCFLCGLEKDPAERGWVTVLAPPGEPRIRYCPECMAELFSYTATPAGADTVADGGDEATD